MKTGNVPGTLVMSLVAFQLVYILLTNYTKNASFYFDVTKIYILIKGLEDISKINIPKDSIFILEKKLKEISERTVSANRKNKTISILTEFNHHIRNSKELDTTQAINALRIKYII